VTDGIVQAIERLLADSGVERDALTAVMIGTTHFTNAIVEHGDPPRRTAGDTRGGAVRRLA
jgi:N-methylhydantoinase A/oxoprolinase/acetone carboxylase beta subunit